MSPLAIVLMVVAILVGVAAIQAAIWIPIIRKLHRLPDQLRDELTGAGERIVRAPERGNYNGATSIYGRVKGMGVIAMTDRRIAFRKAIGKPVDLPVDQIVGVRDDLWFLGAASRGRRHLIVKLQDGVEVGFYVTDHAGWRAALAPIAEAQAHART